MQTLINQPGFQQWIENSLENKKNILATSNQGTILHFQGDGLEAVVKAAMGRGVILHARQTTLLREHAAYLRLDGLKGVPECYGLVNNKYLVLEFIKGTPYRHATWQDRDRWFEGLLDIIQGFHARGVSHGDLKSKANMLVTEDEQPCVIDFGTTFIHKTGFHPVNNYLFRYASRLDINAWVKHKYHGRYKNASDEDQDLLRYSLLEKVIRRIRGRPMH